MNENNLLIGVVAFLAVAYLVLERPKFPPMLIPSIVLGGCILGAAYLVTSAPPAPQQRPQEYRIRVTQGLPGL